MIPGAVPQSLNSLTDLEKIKEQSQWVDVSINTELPTVGQKSGPRRPPRRVKRRHTWEWMWAKWPVWGEAQPRSGEPWSDRLTRGPTEAHPEPERERESEWIFDMWPDHSPSGTFYPISCPVSFSLAEWKLLSKTQEEVSWEKEQKSSTLAFISMRHPASASLRSSEVPPFYKH